jgi:hypothetical protein
MSTFVKQHIRLRLNNLNKLQDVFDQNVVNVTKQWLKESNEELYFMKNYVYNLSLYSIYFGTNFNQPITAGVLSTSLRSIYFGANFNQPITPSVLPPGLRSIYFGTKFNQPITAGVLSTSLRSIYFGANFNQPITPGVLSPGLRSIYFYYNYVHPFPIRPGLRVNYKDD